jgi:hypothetical protein
VKSEKLKGKSRKQKTYTIVILSEAKNLSDWRVRFSLALADMQVLGVNNQDIVHGFSLNF